MVNWPTLSLPWETAGDTRKQGNTGDAKQEIQGIQSRKHKIQSRKHGGYRAGNTGDTEQETQGIQSWKHREYRT